MTYQYNPEHRIYILTNSANEAYIIVCKARWTLEYLKDTAFSGCEADEKKNPVRNRFIRDSKDLKMEIIETGRKFKTLREVLDYRDDIIAQYQIDGYIVLDEKHYKELDKPADSNFAFILKKLDIKAAVAKYSQEVLIQARKSMTTGEFLEEFSV